MKLINTTYALALAALIASPSVHAEKLGGVDAVKTNTLKGKSTEVNRQKTLDIRRGKITPATVIKPTGSTRIDQIGKPTVPAATAPSSKLLSGSAAEETSKPMFDLSGFGKKKHDDTVSEAPTKGVEPSTTKTDGRDIVGGKTEHMADAEKAMKKMGLDEATRTEILKHMEGKDASLQQKMVELIKASDVFKNAQKLTGEDLKALEADLDTILKFYARRADSGEFDTILSRFNSKEDIDAVRGEANLARAWLGLEKIMDGIKSGDTKGVVDYQRTEKDGKVVSSESKHFADMSKEQKLQALDFLARDWISSGNKSDWIAAGKASQATDLRNNLLDALSKGELTKEVAALIAGAHKNGVAKNLSDELYKEKDGKSCVIRG